MSENTVNFNFDDFEEAFAAAEVPENKKPDEVPNGKYVVRVEKVSFDNSTTGLPLFKTQLRISSGQHKGRVLFMNNCLKNKDGKTNDIAMKVLKGFFTTCGVKFTTLKDAASKLSELLDTYLEVNKTAQKNDATRYNLFVNTKVDAPDEGDEPVGVNSSADVPF